MGPLAVPIISVIVSVAGGVAQYMSSSAQAKAEADRQQKQMEAQMRANEENTRAALKEAALQSDAEGVKQVQEKEASSREINQARIENLNARGTALASVGTGMYNVDALMADYERQLGQRADDISLALKQKNTATAINKENIHERTYQRISSQQGYIGGVVEKPSAWGAAFGIIGNGINSFYQASRGSFG